MRFLVSCSDNGSIKEVVCNKLCDTSVMDAVQPLNISSKLAQGSSGAIEKIVSLKEDTSLFICGRKSGVVELVKSNRIPKSSVAEEQEEDNTKTETETTTEKKDTLEIPKPEFDISEFQVLDKIEGLLDNSRLEPLYKKSKKRSKLVDGLVTLSLLPGSKDTIIAVTRSGMVHFLRIDKQTEKLSVMSSLEVKAPLEFAQLYDLNENAKSYDSYFMAYGGEENLIKIVQIEKDLQKLKQIWEAKNVKNDRLDLRVPVWPMDLRFLKSNIEKSSFKFLAITRYSHLAKYDTNHGRKPFEYIDLLPNREPLTNLELFTQNDTYSLSNWGNINSTDFNEDFGIITTDSKKDVIKFNHKGRMLGKIGRGDISGYASFISVTNNQKDQYLLEGGFDGYLRVFEPTSNKRIIKCYVNSKIESIIMLDDDEIFIPGKDDLSSKKKAAKKASLKRQLSPEEDEIDAEDLWNKLDSKTSKKKSKN